MNRIALGNGQWFDADAAEKFDEDDYHDGSNMISRATGSQWEHEALYRSKSGKWILNHWSQWEGSTETYEAISPEEAAAWLARNDHEPPEDLAAAFASLEV